MKNLLFALAVCTTINAQTMSNSEHLDLHSEASDQSQNLKQQKLSQIDENKARTIAEKECKEKNIKLTLKHHNHYLYYVATTATCKVYIDAFNGNILTQKDIKNKK